MQRIGRTQPLDRVDEWIREARLTGSFIDIGGIGEFACNERVSWAKTCGFTRYAMADMEAPDHALWQHYEKESARVGFDGFERHPHINVDDPQLAEKLGRWDLVHSTGILYHVPNPIRTILNYFSIVGRDLIINTVVAPAKISNRYGDWQIPRAAVLFTPALERKERDILRTYYREKFKWDLDKLAPRRDQQGAIMPYMLSDGAPSYYPYWWLFTKEAFEAAATTLGMKIVDTYTWEDHAHFLWLRRP